MISPTSVVSILLKEETDFNEPQLKVGNICYTRPKPVDHGYVFSMAVGTIWEWLKLVPFLLGDVQCTFDSVDSVNTLKYKYYGLGP